MRSKDPELARKINDFIDHYYRDHHCVPTQQEVAAALDVSQPTILRYLRSMDESKVLSYNGKVTETPEIKKCFTDYFSAPVVGSINCGDPEEEKEEVEQYVSLPTSIFGKGEFYLLRAQGTSMLDAGIKPGDLIVVRKQPTAEVGDIVVALDDNNQNTLKRFAGFDKKTGKAVLLYQNEKDYPNKRILVDELVVQGISKNVISYI